MVANRSSVVHVSAASLWEIAVKVDLGRLEVSDGDLTDEIQANGFVELPLAARHGWVAGWLPRRLEDPFGALLVAQAMVEDLTMVNPGGELAVYDVPLL